MRVLNGLRITLLGLLICILTSISLAQSSPRQVVEEFLAAWAEQDYAAMYQHIYTHMIAGEPEFPEPIFTQRYEQVATAIGLDSLTYTINRVEEQGLSALVRYDVVMQSSTYGEINDPNRVIRLVNFNNTWQIAWSTQDIFAGLTNGGRVQVQSQSGVRAPIYDRNGQILATDTGTTVGMNTAISRMASEQACAETLGRALLQPTLTIQRRWANLNAETVFFLTEMPTETFQQYRVELQNNCGVTDGYSSQPHRTYYGGPAVAHVTGYVGIVSPEEEAIYGQGQLVGKAGIERSYNDVLAGQQERVVQIIGANGEILRELGSASGTEPVPVQLTLDRNLQMIVAEAMNDAFNYATTNWGGYGQHETVTAPGGAAVVLDVNTGEVLAMVSYPGFDPTIFNSSYSLSRRFATDGSGESYSAALAAVTTDNRNVLLNRATNQQVFPGSVFKLVTLAAALNEGVIGFNEQFDCTLIWEGQAYGDTRESRPDWRATDNFPPAGLVTPAEALMASCNPFFWQYGVILFRDVRPSVISDYAKRMGLAQTYFDGAIEEVQGSVPVPTFPEEAINEAVGQGDVSVTPLQMAALTAALANGGTLYRPQIVYQVGGLDSTPTQQTFEVEVINELNFNDGVMDEIQRGMCGVTTNEFLGTAFGRFVGKDAPTSQYDYQYHYADTTVPYTLCGKTGTAERGIGVNPNAWFVAYAPADNPEIAVVVMVEQALEGSQVSAPIARRILDNYFNVPEEPYPIWWYTDVFTPLRTPDGGGLG